MNQDKNHWIALFLSGKYPGFNRTPDKLLFIDSLQEINPKSFSDDKIKIFGLFGQVDEYEFYFSFLNKAERDFNDQYESLLRKLQVPNELYIGVGVESFPYERLLTEFKALKIVENAQQKGKAFEDFLKNLFNSVDGLQVANIEQAEDEQIDLVIKNNINKPFWINLGSAIIVGEAKNWTKKTGAEVLNNLDGKINNHESVCQMGIVIALNGFSSATTQTQTRKGPKHVIVKIEGDDISNLLESKMNPIDWLEGIVMNTFV